jgi:hypothetical protein
MPHRNLVLLLLLAGCKGSVIGPESTVPQLGRYDFETSIAGVAYGGTLTITAASASELTYTMVMVSGQTETNTATYSQANGYVLSAHANGWNMIPHLTRSGSAYGCYGNAVFPSTVMACSFTYLGP